MRRRAKIDANQPLIVRALRDAGATVKSTSQLGDGFPDLVVGWRGKNFMFEVKDPTKKPSERKLTDDEKAFHFGWSGQVCIIESVEDALKVMESC